VEARRIRDLDELYGLTPEHYAALALAQRGTCPVCRQLLRRPVVDHDHSKPPGGRRSREKLRAMPAAEKRAAVRGLVCGYPCNYILLRKGLRPEMLRNAAHYLEQPPAHFVLPVVDSMLARDAA